jgi:hypothetical protein
MHACGWHVNAIQSAPMYKPHASMLSLAIFAVFAPAVPMQTQPPPPILHDATPSALLEMSPFLPSSRRLMPVCLPKSVPWCPPCSARGEAYKASTLPYIYCCCFVMQPLTALRCCVSLQWPPPSCTRTRCSRCKARAPMTQPCTAPLSRLPGASRAIEGTPPPRLALPCGPLTHSTPTPPVR